MDSNNHPAQAESSKIVVVIGGGFAGLNAAKKLSNQKNIHVVLVDAKNHHLFQPLLYQVATAGLNPSNIAVPIRAQFSNVPNVEVHMGKVDGVDLSLKQIIVGAEKFQYDYLVIACGAQHSYFGKNEWEPYAPGLKTLEQATEIRRRILSAFEKAENEEDEQKRNAFLTFVIVGGGPTGIELAGAISDISRTVLYNDFKRIDPKKARVVLVEAGSRLLAAFDEKLSAQTLSDLQKLQVEVCLSSRVQNINERGVQIGEEWIEASSVFWAAGVQARALAIEPSVTRDRSARVQVTKDFSIPNFPHTFVIGDMALYEIEPQKYLPGLAPVAIQAGQYVGEAILADLQGHTRPTFKYIDKGQMATIGKFKAVMQSGPLRMHGFFAWLAWLFIHVLYLVGFKNRVSVMSEWAWSYIFSKRGSRLITDKDWQINPPTGQA